MKKLFLIVMLLSLVGVVYWIMDDIRIQSPTSLSDESERIIKKEVSETPPIPTNNTQIDADLWRFYHEFKRISALQPEPCTPFYSPDEERLVREAIDLAINGEADVDHIIRMILVTDLDTHANWRDAVDAYALRKFPQIDEIYNPQLKGLSIEEILQKVKVGEITTGLRTFNRELASRIFQNQWSKALVDDIKASGLVMGAQFFSYMLPSAFDAEDLFQKKKEVFMYAFADADFSELRHDPLVLKNPYYLYRALARTGDTELIEFALDRGLPAFEKPYHTLADAVIDAFTLNFSRITEPNPNDPRHLTSEMLVDELKWLAKRGFHPTDSSAVKIAKEYIEKYPGKAPVFEAYINNLNQFEDVEKAEAELADEMNYIKDRLRLHESDLKDFKKSMTQRDCDSLHRKFNQKKIVAFKKVSYDTGEWIDNAYASGKTSEEIEAYMSQTSGFLVGFKREWVLQKEERANPIGIHDDLRPILSQFFRIDNPIEQGLFSQDDLNSRNFMYPLIMYYVFDKEQRDDAPKHLKAIKAMGGDLNMMCQAMQYYSRLNHKVITRRVYDVLEGWGVDLSLPTIKGNNSFYMAIYNKDLALAKHLHSKGVPAISDPLLENPLEMAMRMPEVGTPEVIKYLRSLGLTNRMEDK